jgi:hypothetical protein
LDKIGWLCHIPRLPTIVDGQSIISQAGLLTGQLTGISEDDLGPILIRPAFHYCELVMRRARPLSLSQGGPA